MQLTGYLTKLVDKILNDIQKHNCSKYTKDKTNTNTKSPGEDIAKATSVWETQNTNINVTQIQKIQNTNTK